MTPQENEPKGWNGMKRMIAQQRRDISALRNIIVQRSGSSDTVSIGQDSMTINLQNFPKSTGGVGGGGGAGNPGLLIYRADGTQEFILIADVFKGQLTPSGDYDPDTDANWSLNFAVTTGALVAFSTTAPYGTSAMPLGEERFDGDASADPVEDQTYYRIPVVRTIDTVKYTYDIAGIYRENIFCAGSKGAIVELIKIG